MAAMTCKALSKHTDERLIQVWMVFSIPWSCPHRSKPQRLARQRIMREGLSGQNVASCSRDKPTNDLAHRFGKRIDPIKRLYENYRE